MDRFASPFAKVNLAPAYQFATNALISHRRMNHDGADHALFIRQPGPVFIRSETRMHKADDF